jgi:sec-independent protein translocase protein TatB
MFDLSWSHILILLVVALVVVGPQDMPKLLRLIGQWVSKARSMANEFRQSFDDMARQSELDELRKEIDNLRNDRPLSQLETDMKASVMTPLPPGPAMTQEVMTDPAIHAPEAMLPLSEPSEPLPDTGITPPSP